MKILLLIISCLSASAFAQFNYGAGPGSIMGQMRPGTPPDWSYIYELRESEEELVGEMILLVIPSDSSSLSASVNREKTNKDAVKGELVSFEASPSGISYILKTENGDEVLVSYFRVNSAKQLDKLRFVL